MAEFHARQTKDWASFREDLKVSVDEAFPDIKDPAQE